MKADRAACTSLLPVHNASPNPHSVTNRRYLTSCTHQSLQGQQQWHPIRAAHVQDKLRVNYIQVRKLRPHAPELAFDTAVLLQMLHLRRNRSPGMRRATRRGTASCWRCCRGCCLRTVRTRRRCRRQAP